uniref:AlNc14C72G4948 protein n=1 Tax=Albugo laibachii Nc14 TaxID=890382 RepID=F0WE92_9STRA|nr:AlNc14C72G4948 [Albugo laibachii Nc14]|eukprot:CCA19522.1 AlNc14C72G4948 [Albugo laibachii Nc14]
MQLESNHKKTVAHLEATLEQKKMGYSQLETEHGRLMVEHERLKTSETNKSVKRVDEVIIGSKKTRTQKDVEELTSPAKHSEESVDDYIGSKDQDYKFMEESTIQKRDGNGEDMQNEMICYGRATGSLCLIQPTHQWDAVCSTIKSDILSSTTSATSEESLSEMDGADDLAEESKSLMSRVFRFLKSYYDWMLSQFF